MYSSFLLLICLEKMTCIMTNLEVILSQVNSHLEITGLYGLTIISLEGRIEVG